ncbi:MULTISPECIES: MCE family protein [Rhodococcus]|uniref:Mce family protein n=3 Tax=Rhodococcus TaxID=1827 RepID=A0AB38FLE2_RHOWR|nr:MULTISPECIES: MCE family protein [Rhodococcus]AII09210.1 mammalian cell entry protein [Rhodococcus opacus]REE76259.1 phospholipid/cholesterol/gamma-HCH transport system substrate-binding protein [Rhodococcus wratislaviensis]WAM13412.1 MCE family protein [Rhodococcus sp. JS3073]SPZ42381.1 Mce family protein [Rhodococcus wratislaviensis]GAF46204.1 Mce family protein [Rhodococcus wratislaviensis NBRC 100605]
MKRSVILGAGACAVAIAVTSCSSEGIYGVPLPGGPDVGDHPMHLTIQFDDVLDLVPQSAVKVDGVPVGRVESIKVAPDGWTADVEVVLDSSVDLAANAVAAIEQTNLLGEKFVQLSEPPEDKDPARLEDGDTISLDRTRHATEIEQVLGALSLLLNGGGVGQLQPIVHELTTALDGREDRVRGLLEQANTLIDGLNQQRDDITRALDGLDALTTRVNEQNEKIGLILDQLPIAAEVLNEQRPQLTQMLTQLDRLGTVGTDVINRSKNDLIADLLALRPTLKALAESGDDLPNSLAFIPTVPFPDGVEKIALGGSVNLFLTVDLQIGDALSALGVGQGDPVYVPPKFGEPKPIVDPSNPYYNGNGPKPGWPTVSLLPIPPIIPAPTGLRIPGLPGTAPAAGNGGAENGTTDGAAPSPQNPLGGLLEQFGIGGGQ